MDILLTLLLGAIVIMVIITFILIIALQREIELLQDEVDKMKIRLNK